MSQEGLCFFDTDGLEEKERSRINDVLSRASTSQASHLVMPDSPTRSAGCSTLHNSSHQQPQQKGVDTPTTSSCSPNTTDTTTGGSGRKPSYRSGTNGGRGGNRQQQQSSRQQQQQRHHANANNVPRHRQHNNPAANANNSYVIGQQQPQQLNSPPPVVPPHAAMIQQPHAVNQNMAFMTFHGGGVRPPTAAAAMPQFVLPNLQCPPPSLHHIPANYVFQRPAQPPPGVRLTTMPPVTCVGVPMAYAPQQQQPMGPVRFAASPPARRPAPVQQDNTSDDDEANVIIGQVQMPPAPQQEETHSHSVPSADEVTFTTASPEPEAATASCSFSQSQQPPPPTTNGIVEPPTATEDETTNTRLSDSTTSATPTPVVADTAQNDIDNSQTQQSPQQQQSTPTPKDDVDSHPADAAKADVAAPNGHPVAAAELPSPQPAQSADNGTAPAEVEATTEPAESTEPAKVTLPAPKSWASLFNNTKAKVVYSSMEQPVPQKVAAEKPAANAGEAQQNGLPPTKTLGSFMRGEDDDAEPQVVAPEQDPCLGEILSLMHNFECDHSAPKFKLRGLHNIGNWCYVNAVLQALLVCPPFFHFLHALIPFARRRPTSTPICDALAKFVGEFVDSTGVSGKPARRAQTSPFEPRYVHLMARRLRADSSFKGRQEDAEEFLLAIFNGMHDELEGISKTVTANGTAPVSNGTTEPAVVSASESEEADDEWQEVGKGGKTTIHRQVQFESTPIAVIFGGSLRYSLSKGGGFKDSSNIEPFFTLPLDIQESDSLEAAIEQTLCGETFKAMRAKREVEVHRIGRLDHLPQVLVLQLKCFVYQNESVMKLLKPITYPMELEIEPGSLTKGAAVPLSARSYKLHAVVFHHGAAAEGGHYTLHMFHAGKWVNVDDTKVTNDVPAKPVYAVDPTADGRNTMPYILFYRRCDLIHTTKP